MIFFNSHIFPQRLKNIIRITLPIEVLNLPLFYLFYPLNRTRKKSAFLLIQILKLQIKIKTKTC